jgi:hypothetical protein
MLLGIGGTRRFLCGIEAATGIVTSAGASRDETKDRTDQDQSSSRGARKHHSSLARRSIVE